jgi:hypothetical protein
MTAPDAEFGTALISTPGGVAERLRDENRRLRQELDKAEASAIPKGCVVVCRMLDCEWKHEYQWGDCEAANCPLTRAKPTQEPKT